MFLIVLLVLLLLLFVGLGMGLEWFKNSWYFVVQFIIGFLTLGALYFQYKHDKLMEKFTISPHVNKRLVLKGMSKTWRFDLEELIWIAPKGVKDYLISIKGYY